MNQGTSKIRSFFKLTFANLVIFLLATIMIELCGQAYLYFHPSFNNNCAIPHKILGWKYAPHCNFVHTGGRYNAEFEEKITTNSHGFRDKERTLTKPSNTIRIAFMGDSMMEALQVPFGKTAGQVLENKLNRMSNSDNNLKYEVLNFGVGNYGLGQMFLAYKEFAEKFNPDYVLVFVNEYLMERTIEFQRFETQIKSGNFFSNRPVFWFKNPKLTKEINLLSSNKQRYFSKLEKTFFLINPPIYLSGFKKWYQETLSKRQSAKKNPEKTLKERQRGFFLEKLWRNFKKDFNSWKNTSEFEIKLSKLPIVEEVKVPINLKILSIFQKESQARFIILDSSKYYHPDEKVSSFLKYFIDINEGGYVDLSAKLIESERNGEVIRWRGDSHFNVKGQKILGEIIFDGIASNFR